MLIIDPGTKKGETRLNDFLSRISLFFSMLSKPPIPDPMFKPTLSLLILSSMPASSKA